MIMYSTAEMFRFTFFELHVYPSIATVYDVANPGFSLGRSHGVRLISFCTEGSSKL